MITSFRRQDPRFTISQAYHYYVSQACRERDEDEFKVFYNHNYMGQKLLSLMLGGAYCQKLCIPCIHMSFDVS